MELVSFRQQVTLHANPEEVYQVLMDSRLHSDLTSSECVISPEVGGDFSVYDGYASGKTIELVPGKRIIQSWRAEEKEWPEKYFSEIHFELEDHGDGRTTIHFQHRNVPALLEEPIKNGWIAYYWEPLREWFNRS